MDIKRSSLIALTLTLMLIFAGCSDNPASPTTSQEPVLSTSSGRASGHYCAGYYSLGIDTATGEISAVRQRSAEWHFNLVGILNSTMGVGAAGVPGESNLAEGLVVMDITLTHPFASKPQFAGFDVKGILMAPGSLAAGSLILSDADETCLENADGYTRWWNPSEFTAPGMFGYIKGTFANADTVDLTATINPYMLFADILDYDDSLSWITGTPLDDPAGRAVFKAGSSNVRRYRIRFPMDPGPQVIYGYAVDCSWNAPSPNPPTEVPDDFPINANQPEAYRVSVQPAVNTLYYDSESSSAGGVLRLQINVYDWQGQAVGSVTPEISTVKVYAPDIISSPVDAVYLNETTDKTRYTVDLTGTAVPTHSGPVKVLVRVESSDGSTYQQTAAPAPAEPLSAYQAITVDIQDPECLTDANNDWLEAVPLTWDAPMIDQVCLPDDYRDFYTFTYPAGFEPTGDIRLTTDVTPTTLGIYTMSQSLIAEQTVSGGSASISFEFLDLDPGSYYIRVLTSNNTMTAPYLLELTGVLQDVTPDTPVDVTPADLFCLGNNIFHYNNLVILTHYQGVFVYDVTDSNNPVLLSRSDFNTTNDLCFRYPYMYFATNLALSESQLNMVDFTDPSHPVLHENLIHYAFQLDDCCMNSTHLYIGTYVSPTCEVYIYDYISNPVNPTEVCIFSVPYSPQIMTLSDPEGSDTKLVIGTWDSIYSYNVENHSAVTPSGSYTFTAGCARDIVADESWIYAAADHTFGGEGWLHVFYQGPDYISSSGSVDVPGSANYIDLEWPYAYIGDGSAGLTICDVSDPANPDHISSMSMVSYANDLKVENNLVYVLLTDEAFQIVDVSTPLSPDLLGRPMVLTYTYSIVQKDNYLIAAQAGYGPNGGLKTLDISDPPNTFVAAEVFPGDRPYQLSLDGDLLGVRHLQSWGLYDASDPLHLTFLSTKTETSQLNFLKIHNDVAYVSPNISPGEIKTYDVSNPSAPLYDWTVSLTSGVNDICIASDFMYVSTNDGKIEVYDLVNPLMPNNVFTYSHSLMGYYQGAAQGDYLYFAASDNLEIVDISSPGSPSYAGSILLPPPALGYYSYIAVDGQFAYLAGYNAIIQSCLVWPPDSPSLVGPVYAGYAYDTRQLIVDVQYLYAGTASWGLKIYDLY